MYKYQDIGFRPIEKKDLEALRKLHNDMSTALQMGTVDFYSDEDQLKWWESGVSNERNKRFAIVLNETDEVIGRLRILNIDNINSNCEIGLDIVPELRGKGYGKKSYEMVLDFLFNQWNMHLVYLKVADFNPTAKKLYESIGFEYTGKFPEYLYRNGKYWDYLLMSIVKK